MPAYSRVMMLGILVGVVCSAVAQQRYPELIGEWMGTGVGNCTPCIINIQDVQDNGQLVLQSSVAGDPVESWGQVTRDGDKINVRITMAGDSTFELSPARSGKYLQGSFRFQAQAGGSSPVSMTRVK